MTRYEDVLATVITEVVAPNAQTVDQQGSFPRASIERSRRHRAARSGEQCGCRRRGGGMGDAAAVIEQLAGACGSTAMVTSDALRRHRRWSRPTAPNDPARDRRRAPPDHPGVFRSRLPQPLLGSASAPPPRPATGCASTARRAGSPRRRRPTATSGPPAASPPMDRCRSGWSRPAPPVVPAERVRRPRAAGQRVHAGDGRGCHGDDDALLGADGAGLDVALAVVLPWFLVLSAAFSLGLMEAVMAETGRHLAATRLEHLGQTLIEQPLARADYARMRVSTDTIRALLNDAADRPRHRAGPTPCSGCSSQGARPPRRRSTSPTWP